MRPVSFPLTLVPGAARKADYIVFASRYRQVFKKIIPTSSDVLFLSLPALRNYEMGMESDEKNRIIQHVQAKRQPLKAGSTTILFPLTAEGDDLLVAVVSGIDPVVVEKASDEWLRESSGALEREFAQIRKGGSDSISSLYNAFLFSEMLSANEGEKDFHVVLVELLPRARSPRDAFSHVLRMSRSLAEYNRFSFPLFHLGQSVFAFILPDRDRQFLKTFCLSLITFMKMKQAKRVHCGCSSLNINRSERLLGGSKRMVIVDEAWHALHVACRRGPFAFCDYDILANPENFPLQPVSRSTLAGLQRRWRHMDRFCLVCLTPDFENRSRLDTPVRDLLDGENLVIDKNGYFVIKHDLEAEEGKMWALEMINRLKERHGNGYSFSAGVSSYPFENYPKSRIVRNCQKALVHGAFFGPGSCVVFDALSLNISGDIYFGEGDLLHAVREYRHGNDLAGFDSNLLNSLGVTYALMNRTSEALKTFDKVLEREPKNFMALYNKGLIEQSTGNHATASYCFNAALKLHDPADAEERGALNDLNYQLGIALFHCGEFRQSAEQLEFWYEEQQDKKSAGKCCRFIGVSYYHLDRVPEASTWLQRGLSFDEFDGEALSLLSELYLKEKQGDEIALRLAEKSVEIDNTNCIFLLRYGRALASCGYDSEAIAYFKRCGGWKKTRHEAWFELMSVYLRQKNEQKARLYEKKLNNSRTGVNAKRGRM